MPLAVFYASALSWAFACTAIAIVVAPWTRSRPSYVKSALVGAIVGIVFGLATLYLISFIGIPIVLFKLLAPAHLDRFAVAFASILLATAAGGLTGTAVGALVAPTRWVVRRCAGVGAVFGLTVGLANQVAITALRSAFAAITGTATIGGDAAVTYGWTAMLCIAFVNMTLAVVAIRYVRAGRPTV